MKKLLLLLFVFSVRFIFADGLSPNPLADVVKSADFIGEVKVLIVEGDTSFVLDDTGDLKSQNQEYLIAGRVGWMFKGIRPRRHLLFRHSIHIMKGFWVATDASGLETNLREGQKYIFFWRDRGDGHFILIRVENITSRMEIMTQLGQK